MTWTEQWLYVNEELWFILFGLECTLHVEFDASATESLFQNDKAGKVQDREYVLFSGRSLRVTATTDFYELGSLLLKVESSKPFEPSLEALIERAKFQVFRMQRWHEADEPAA